MAPAALERKCSTPAGRPRREQAAGPRAVADLSARLQDAPRPVVAMASRYPHGGTSTWHSHRRGQFIVALAGVCTVATKGRTFVVPPGHGLWIAPGVVHQSRAWSVLDTQAVYIEPPAACSLPLRCRLVRTTPLVRALMEEMIRQPVLYDEGGREGLVAALLLAEIGRLPEASLHVPSPEDPRLSGLCDAFLADPASSPSIADWATLSHMSRRTLTRLFRRQTGLSIGAWQQQVRLLGALARLGNGGTVTAVALDAGYSSPSAFTAMFRRKLGMCPRSFLGTT